MGKRNSRAANSPKAHVAHPCAPFLPSKLFRRFKRRRWLAKIPVKKKKYLWSEVHNYGRMPTIVSSLQRRTEGNTYAYENKIQVLIITEQRRNLRNSGRSAADAGRLLGTRRFESEQLVNRGAPKVRASYRDQVLTAREYCTG